MHFICVIGTLLLMVIPYVVSRTVNGLCARTSGRSALVNCTFFPRPEEGLERLHELAVGNVTFNCTCSAAARTAGKVILLQIKTDKSDVLDVVDGNENEIDCGREDTSAGTIYIKGKFLGREDVMITAGDKSKKGGKVEEEGALVQCYPVSVMRMPTGLDTAFIVIIATLVGINTINMGCHLDLTVVKENLKKPCAIGIGFTSQYIFMPLIAYGIAQALLQEPNLQLGLFTMGCSPGGGASNFWTLLLEGDAHLSITMTFLSTALALVMMPLWLFSLGSTIFGTMQIRIPFSNILTALISLIAPLAIGVLIRRYRPTWADFSKKLIRPFTIFMMLFIFTFGVYANLYMFYVMTWRTMLAGLIVPWCGYVFGATLAVISRRGKQQVIAIAVETGVQNTGIAIVLLRLTLPQPDADLASVVPVCGSIMLFIPLFLWYIGLVIRNRFFPSGVDGKTGIESVSTTEEGSLRDGDGDDELQMAEEKRDRLHLRSDSGMFSGGLGEAGKQPSQQKLLPGVV